MEQETKKQEQDQLLIDPVLVVEGIRNDLMRIIGNAIQAGVPAYQIEGVIDGALADIRKQRCVEVTEAYGRLMMQMQQKSNPEKQAAQDQKDAVLSGAEAERS